MYYWGDAEGFLEKNTAIVGKERSGKTTILKNLIKYCYKNGYTILLFDSSPKTKKNSILTNTRLKYKSNIIIGSPSTEDISFDFMSFDLFPHSFVRRTNYKIYSFDVSKYLEKGYKIDNLPERNVIKAYYKQLVVQELVVMLYLVIRRKCIVLMDEIEFVPIMKSVISRCNILNIPVIATTKEIDNLSTSGCLFDIISLD